MYSKTALILGLTAMGAIATEKTVSEVFVAHRAKVPFANTTDQIEATGLFLQTDADKGVLLSFVNDTEVNDVSVINVANGTFHGSNYKWLYDPNNGTEIDGSLTSDAIFSAIQTVMDNQSYQAWEPLCNDFNTSFIAFNSSVQPTANATDVANNTLSALQAGNATYPVRQPSQPGQSGSSPSGSGSSPSGSGSGSPSGSGSGSGSGSQPAPPKPRPSTHPKPPTKHSSGGSKGGSGGSKGGSGGSKGGSKGQEENGEGDSQFFFVGW